MDKHLHNRTNCPVCLRVPAWQFGLFLEETDFCEEHKLDARFYSELMSDPSRFDEYHDGREVEELARMWQAYDDRIAEEGRSVSWNYLDWEDQYELGRVGWMDFYGWRYDFWD